MRSRLLPLLAAITFFAFVLSACSRGGGAQSDAPLVSIGEGLYGPDGASAVIVASGLANVSGLATDSQGRLWATTAAFTDSGADGLYVIPTAGAAPVEVVSGLHTPMGLLWIEDRLLVSSAEGVLAFDGFDGSRFASEQTLATFSGAGILGELVLGADGRVRVHGISAPCDNCDPDSKWAAAVVSFLRRHRCPCRGVGDSRTRWARVRPWHGRPPHDDEPA